MQSSALFCLGFFFLFQHLLFSLAFFFYFVFFFFFRFCRLFSKTFSLSFSICVFRGFAVPLPLPLPLLAGSNNHNNRGKRAVSQPVSPAPRDRQDRANWLPTWPDAWNFRMRKSKTNWTAAEPNRMKVKTTAAATATATDKKQMKSKLNLNKLRMLIAVSHLPLSPSIVCSFTRSKKSQKKELLTLSLPRAHTKHTHESSWIIWKYKVNTKKKSEKIKQIIV